MTSPNILLIMTDEERYPPPYETEEVTAFRREQLTARESIRASGLEFHRHYAGSMACTPSRATLFTGQYPSLHGVSATDGAAKQATDPEMNWLDPDSVPTLGDWFRAGGYQTHYRGKWHVSHADLLIPGTHEGLMASDDAVPRFPRRSRPTREPTGSTRSVSPGGSAGSRTARRSPTAAWSETASSPSRSSSSSTTSPRHAETAPGLPWLRS